MFYENLITLIRIGDKSVSTSNFEGALYPARLARLFIHLSFIGPLDNKQHDKASEIKQVFDLMEILGKLLYYVAAIVMILKIRFRIRENSK